MKKILNVLGLQADLAWENPKKNLKQFEEQLARIHQKFDLAVLPEMFTTGFTMSPERVAEDIDGPTLQWMQKMAKTYDAAFLGSLPIKEGNQFYNRLFFVHPSGKTETYNKRHSFTLAGENKVYTSGNEKLIVSYKSWNICPLICYDLRFPVWARNTEDYDVLIYIANWPVTRIKAWETLLKARAIENMCYTIGVNRVGKDANGYVYSGNSLIVDYLGTVCAHLKENEVGIVSSR